jgi:hypothetical protein
MLAERFFNRRGDPAQFDKEVIEKIRVEADVRGKEIDGGTYIGVDEQQATLGDIDTTKLSVSEDAKGRSAP